MALRCRNGQDMRVQSYAADDTDKVLVVSEGELGGSGRGLFSLTTGTVTPVPYDPALPEDRWLAAFVKAEEN